MPMITFTGQILSEPANSMKVSELRAMAVRYHPEEPGSPAIYTDSPSPRLTHDAFRMHLEMAPEIKLGDLQVETYRNVGESHKAVRILGWASAAGALATLVSAAVAFHPLAFAIGTGVAGLAAVGNLFREKEEREFARGLADWVNYINTTAPRPAAAPADAAQPPAATEAVAEVAQANEQPRAAEEPVPPAEVVALPPDEVVAAAPAEVVAAAEPEAPVVNVPIRSRPPTKEDEYFARVDRELIEAARRRDAANNAHVQPAS